ncbi:MAG TPA: cytochrome c3 family protein [Rhodanobacteraceae bacterium]|nr:cytochrome c3 family protein [Rhodanobacteraceae bacterium]
MAQLFPRNFGFLFLLGLAVAIGIGLAWVYLWRAQMAYPAGLNDPVEQPVPFSHKHHVGDDGIDCRYCHQSVEQSAFAGIPPLSTCMTCHSQLYTHQPVLRPLLAAFRSGVPLHWKRLYKLPDFVYFNHGIHIAKGVGCATCHGEIDQMPLTARVRSLTMQWCLRCHRDPARYVRPRDEVFNLHWHAQDQLALGAKLVRKYHIDTSRMTDCSLCHR